MVHEIFEVDNVKLTQFFPLEGCAINQAGSGTPFELARFQRGYGLSQVHYQRGSGVGNVLRHIWRYLVPIVKEAGQAITKEGANAGARILQNIAQGADIKEAVITEGKQSLRNLAGSAADKLKQQQEGSGISFKRSRPKKRTRSLDTIRLAGRSLSARALKKKRENLGLF